MQVNREWNHEPEMFEFVFETLEMGLGDERFLESKVNVIARPERSSYGESGTIEIRFDGRVFKLILVEVL